MYQFEPSSDDAGIAENFFYTRGVCLADYVKVLGLFFKKQIPYRATDNVAVVSGFFQPVNYAYCFFINIINADPVLTAGINYSFFNQPAVFFAVSETQTCSPSSPEIVTGPVPAISVKPQAAAAGAESVGAPPIAKIAHSPPAHGAARGAGSGA